jgi:hypothetical protein
MSTVTPAATFPVSNAFATTPSYSGTFIPVIWSSKLNVKFYAASVFPAIANTDWEGEISNMGDKVIIQNAPSITINNYVVGTNLTYEVPVPSTVELTINKGKSFSFQISDVLNYQSKPGLMDMFSNDASEQMRVAVDADGLLGVYNGGAAANKGATAGVKSAGYNMGTDAAPVTLTPSNVLQKILEMASILDEQNIPESNRWLLIDPYTRVLLMQSNLAQAQFMGDAKSIVRNGMIGMIDRFTVYVSNQLPVAAAGQDFLGQAQGGALKRRAIVAGHKSAIAFASQMVKLETLRNPNDFGDLVRGLQVYGYAVLNPKGLVLLLAA